LRKFLIVNADDFGRSQGVNRGVAIAYEQGIVTSASLMVRRPAAAEAALYAQQHPTLSLGLHVDLGEWLFSNGTWEVVDQVPEPLEEAVERQLETFLRLVGHKPTHLDSHQHVHRQGKVGALLIDVAKQLSVPLRANDPRIRFCGDFYGQTARGEPLHDAISVEALVQLITTLHAGITELGCHPGIGTDDDVPYGRERAIEIKTLCDSRVGAAIATNEIELSSFLNI